MAELTKKQQAVLSFLQERAESGLPPTVREICTAAGIKSTSTVHAYLKTLEDGGYISRQSGLNRAIRVNAPQAAKPMPGRVPLLGRVTAGMPILAVEEVEDYVPYTGHLDVKDLFALRVCGTSMINAGILDGDVVIVQRTPTAENGDIVVALIGEEATVKRFFKEDGHFRLQPENPEFAPIIVPEVAVLGRVISLVRYF